MAQININKLFVSVPAGNEAAALAASSQAGNVKKIYFFADGRIVNNGKEYSIATTDYAAVKAAVTKLDGAESLDGSVRNLIKGAKDELNGTISGVDTRVEAIEKLIGGAEDADTKINTVKEVLEWFTDVQETDKGAQLIADVAANKTAIGTKGVEGGAAATGLYLEIENAKAAAIAANTAAIEALDTEDTAVAGQYVSAVSQTDGKITVSREALPTLSVKTGSENYVGVANHEVEIKTSALGSVGITFENNKWTAGTATSETGLATAADVATEIANDELVIAAALNDHEARIQTAEADITTAKADIAALKAEDKVHTTVADNTGNYVKVSTNASSKVVTVAEHVVHLADATSSNTGIADANDVKTYIDTYDFWETYSATQA